MNWSSLSFSVSASNNIIQLQIRAMLQETLFDPEVHAWAEVIIWFLRLMQNTQKRIMYFRSNMLSWYFPDCQISVDTFFIQMGGFQFPVAPAMKEKTVYFGLFREVVGNIVICWLGRQLT